MSPSFIVPARLRRLFLTLSVLLLAACGAPGAPPKQNSKLDFDQLTPRERQELRTLLDETLAPCNDQAVSLQRCIDEKRACRACGPAGHFLLTQVQRGKPREEVEAAYAVRFDPSQKHEISINGSPTRGPSAAPVRVVEWADFECPFCAATAPVLEELVEKYPGKVQLIFKQYPLSFHANAEGAARASIAAGMQGKFWQMHGALFQNQSHGLDPSGLERIAKIVGLKLERFKKDMGGKVASERIAKDRQQAEKLGIKGTPFIFINGRHFDLKKFSLEEDLHNWIEVEIQLTQKPQAGTG